MSKSRKLIRTKTRKRIRFGIRKRSRSTRSRKRLGRKKIMRNIEYIPKVTYFKPNGIPVKELKVVKLEMDEFEALRLKNVENLNQIDFAERMHITQNTFARILDSVNKKIGEVLVEGYAIEINNNNKNK